jgi:hypothetical protein
MAIRRRRVHFSLRGLLVATAAIAVVLAVLNAPPGTWYAGLSLIFLAIAIPSGLVIHLPHVSGYSKTFVMGALVPAFACLSTLANVLPWEIQQSRYTADLYTIAELQECLKQISMSSFQFSFGVFWCLAPINGLLCVFTHWLFIRPPEPKA